MSDDGYPALPAVLPTETGDGRFIVPVTTFNLDDAGDLIPVRSSELVTWIVRNDEPTTLVYTDDNGTEHFIGEPDDLPDTLLIPATAWENLRRYVERPAYDWPRRGFTDEQVSRILGFVARGWFTRTTLAVFVSDVMYPTDPSNVSGWWSITTRTIRRAKRENRIAWSPHDQCYVALPAWRHKPIHDRRGWNWPKP